VAVCLACCGIHLGWLCLLAVITYPHIPSALPFTPLPPTHPPVICSIHDITACAQKLFQNQPVQVLLYFYIVQSYVATIKHK